MDCSSAAISGNPDRRRLRIVPVKAVPDSRRAIRGVLVGLLTAWVALGVAQLVAGLSRPQGSPVAAVGSVAIDNTPPAVKNFAIATFGSHDKLALVIGILVLLAVFSAADRGAGHAPAQLWLRRAGRVRAGRHPGRAGPAQGRGGGCAAHADRGGGGRVHAVPAGARGRRPAARTGRTRPRPAPATARGRAGATAPVVRRAR